jgi:hypothetical protein
VERGREAKMSSSDKSYLEFLDAYTARALQNAHMRRGQVLFNTLMDYRKDIARQIHDSDYDPFYYDTPAVITRALWFIADKWYGGVK